VGIWRTLGAGGVSLKKTHSVKGQYSKFTDLK
jgi:hypothetical protein